MNIANFDKFAGCIIGGAIGDAYGGICRNTSMPRSMGGPDEKLILSFTTAQKNQL